MIVLWYYTTGNLTATNLGSALSSNSENMYLYEMGGYSGFYDTVATLIIIKILFLVNIFGSTLTIVVDIKSL